MSDWLQRSLFVPWRAKTLALAEACPLAPVRTGIRAVGLEDRQRVAARVYVEKCNPLEVSRVVLDLVDGREDVGLRQVPP